MLTIRANGIHGDESIFQAAYVIRGSDAGKTNGENGMLEFFDATHEKVHQDIFFGRVFVMNDAGKTVADYNLGGWEHAEK